VKQPSDPDDKKPREIQVTDRRMFTPEGELKEEYRALEERRRETPAPAEPPASPPERPAPPAAGPAAAPPGGEPRGTPVEIPGLGPGPGPSFFDLVAVLSEPVPLYLGDATLPDGRSVEDLEAARFHIDLLDVLRQATAGNLGAQEAAVLEDLLYRLRMRYVQKRG
jgi:hypothetical protein